MDYNSYKKYRKSLPTSLLALDNLNPYELLEYVNERDEGVELVVAKKNQFIQTSSGVRELLKELFIYFTKMNYQLLLPEDIYPIYFGLGPDNADIIKYTTYQQQKYALPDKSKSVLLVTNPVIPEGKYISTTQLENINTWLNDDENRWLIMDCVYDYKGSSLTYDFDSCNVIYLNSLSKVALTPSLYGWAVSNIELPGFKETKKKIMKVTHASFLQKLYESAWHSLLPKLTDIDTLWKVPEVGYLTTINIDYQSLMKHGIAGLPASVFGIKQKNVSVISCLSENEKRMK